MEEYVDVNMDVDTYDRLMKLSGATPLLQYIREMSIKLSQNDGLVGKESGNDVLMQLLLQKLDVINNKLEGSYQRNDFYSDDAEDFDLSGIEIRTGSGDLEEVLPAIWDYLIIQKTLEDNPQALRCGWFYKNHDGSWSRDTKGELQSTLDTLKSEYQKQMNTQKLDLTRPFDEVALFTYDTKRSDVIIISKGTDESKNPPLTDYFAIKQSLLHNPQAKQSGFYDRNEDNTWSYNQYRANKHRFVQAAKRLGCNEQGIDKLLGYLEQFSSSSGN